MWSATNDEPHSEHSADYNAVAWQRNEIDGIEILLFSE